ncbi:hypothetical protein [Streptomyces sp. NPDC031705]|uniref:ATP-dependent DNA ligase n=1 Tax=Streptomyces sp. NPDC031705 TaxID=3155729 RepID=UPI0033EFD12D
MLLQTRRGSLVQDRWPDLVAAAEERLPHGLVLDGELLVWDAEAGRLSFEALQRRAAARGRGAVGLVGWWPAYFVAFDVLQQDSQELLHLPYAERRARLEALFTDHALTAPWTLCLMTTDLAVAREWLESWTDVSGVEGILIKPLTSRYHLSYRGWTKIRRRDTTRPRASCGCRGGLAVGGRLGPGPAGGRRPGGCGRGRWWRPPTRSRCARPCGGRSVRGWRRTG